MGSSSVSRHSAHTVECISTSGSVLLRGTRVSTMTSEEKRAYLAQVDAMRKAAVADQIQPAKLLSDKERARFKEVKTMLEEGKNPFSHEELSAKGKNLGGSTPEDRKMAKRELTEAQVKALEIKWKSGKGHAREVVYLEDIDLGVGPAKPTIRDDFSPIIYCSYCGTEVDEINATEGRGKLKIQKIEDLELVGGEPRITSKIRASSDKIIACPDCVLNIDKPKFKETHG
jgi:hypothetical protein